MNSPVLESSLVKTEGYDTIRKGENVPLRDLDNFIFYTKRKKGTRLVAIEDIEEGEPIYGRGRLMPKKGSHKPQSKYLVNIMHLFWI
ncbi:hypothetical protein HW132_35375 [Brasilonema sp. CT11]|nr:hypothetical protein [Brasilonema sp. CT11]